MTLWIVLTLMIALAASGLTIPLVRRHDARDLGGSTLGVLKAQLADIDAQLAVGTMSEGEAEGLRTEIKRRLLAEGREREAVPRPVGQKTLPYVALGIAAAVALVAAGLYTMLGRPDLVAGSGTPAPQAQADPNHPAGDVTSMIGQLEAKMQQSPNDSEGWRMLGWSYLRTGRPVDAANAYGRAAALEPNNAEYHSAQGDALVQAASGLVTPAALAAFRKALALDPADPRARYFLAVFKDQQGDHKGAMDDWIALIKSAPAGAPWAAEVRGFVERTARERGEDISGRLPPTTVAPSAASPGPTEDQVAAASQMSEADKLAMIHGMLDKLAGELKINPRNAEGWVRLMRAHMVLGEKDMAAEALRDAQKAFADSPRDQAALRDAARSLGVPGA